MLAFCPNFSDPEIEAEFNHLETLVGEDSAYWYYSQFEGDFSAIYDTLTSKGVRVQSAPKVPQMGLKTLPEGSTQDSINNADVTSRLMTGAPIDDTNNKAIWDVENALGLVSIREFKGKKWKFYNPLNKDEAQKAKDWIFHNHLDVGMKVVKPWSNAAGTVGIQLTGWPKNVDQSIAEHKRDLEHQVAKERTALDQEIRADLLPDPIEPKSVDNPNNPKELEDIQDITSKLGWEIHKATDILDLLSDNTAFDERSKEVLEMLQRVVGRHPDLRVQLIKRESAKAGMENSYAYFDPNNNTINLIEEAVHNPETASYDNFAMSVLHEYIHAFTLRSLRNPGTPEEIQLVKDLTRLWKLASKNTKNPGLYGYKNVEEFVAELMTSNELLADLKSQEYKVWQRIVNYIAKFFGIYKTTTDRVGQQTISGETAYKRVLEFIPTQERFDDSGTAVAKEINVITQAKYPLHGTIDLSKRDEAVKLLRGIQDGFTIEKGKGFVHKDTQFTMLPVTAIMSQYNLGVNKNELKSNEKLSDAVERAGNIGSILHGNMESIIKEKGLKIRGENPFTSTIGLRSDLSAIIDTFKGQNVTIMSELYVADPGKGVGGVIDMVIIDEKNRLHIYDFKSKESGFDKWGFRFPNEYNGSLKYSSKQAAHAQLTMYKIILERITGLTVHDMTAVLIEPDINGNKIVGAKLSSKENGLDKWNAKSREGVNIIAQLKNLGAREAKWDNYLSNIPGLEDPTRSYYVESALKTLQYSALEFSQTEKTLNVLMKGLEEQLTYATRTNARGRIRAIEDKIAEVRNQNESMDSLKAILQYALEDTAKLDATYIAAKKQQIKDKKAKITVGQLFGWKRSVEAWDGFGDYATYLADKIKLSVDIDKPENAAVKKEYETIISKIDLVVRRSNNIKDRYVSEGMDKLVTFLAPFYNRVRAEERNNLRKTYRRDKPTGVTEEEYIIKRLAEQQDDIDSRTRDLLRSEMERASTDINSIGMWLDNLLDSKDPITAAMVKAFGRTEEISHRESLNKRNELLMALTEFEKLNSDRNGIVSYKTLYDFMLEKDENGKLTGNFVGKFRSSLFNEFDETGKLIGGYMKVIKDTRNKDPKERDAERRTWKNDRTKFNKVDFGIGKWDFIRTIFKNQPFEEEVTDGHLMVIQQNEQDNKDAFYDENLDGQSLQDLANTGAIPQEFADAIDDWIYKNAWEYREILPQYKKKYENPQWAEIEKLEGAERKLYDLLMDMMSEADQMIPFSSRLGGRLPGVEKRTTEMLKDNMGIVATARQSWNQAWSIRKDDEEHDNFGQAGEEQPFLPIHYTGKPDIELQSFDIPTIVYKFWQSANDFNNKKEILPEMELAKHIIKTRKTDPINSMVFNIKKFLNREEVKANNNNLSRQVEHWFQMAVYGRPKMKMGKIFGIDGNKLADNLMKYTSLNLLGLNVIQGSANAILGEALQTAERIAGEYMSPKAYRRGSMFYAKNFAGVMGDVGARSPKNVVTRLMETFNVLDQWEGTDFSKRQKYRHAMSSNTLFFTTHAGEHEMQGRFLLSMLSDKRAIDKNGKDIGSMLEKYTVDKDTKALVLDPEVSLEKSEWTEDDQFDFQYKVRGILSRLHGEYSDLGRVAIQRAALGRMAFMFRKFVVPGYKRRWGKNAYIERLDDFVEGNYITTGKFLGKFMNDLIHFRFSVGADWGNLTDHEKANVRRTTTEVSFLLMAIILSNLAIAKLKEDGDDDDDRMWSFLAYQALRLRAELLFFIKPDETFSILRSPMATMSVIENLFKLTGQIFEPAERYERGPWKGQLKIQKTITNMAPGYRQFYRVRDLKDQLPWFSSKI